MHKLEQVRDAIYNAVSNLVSSGTIDQVIKSRAELPSSHPCVSIRMGSDVTQRENANFIDSLATIYTDIYLITVDPDLDSQLLDIRKAIHVALMAQPNLGLDFVLKVTPEGQAEPEHSGEGDMYNSATRLSWNVLYRSSYLDPSL